MRAAIALAPLALCCLVFFAACGADNQTKTTDQVSEQQSDASEASHRQAGSVPAWHYGSDWAHDYPQSGSRQSPIHIFSTNAKHEPKLELNISHYKAFTGDANVFEAVNNGHTVSMQPKGALRVGFEAPATTRGDYQLKDVHFHWADKVSGSEHQLDDNHFDAEMHLVNVPLEAIGSGSKPQRLLVIGVLIKANSAHNDAFEPIATAVRQVSCSKQPQDVQVPLDGLLPSSLAKRFYHYKGSLTTPPLDEIVEWIVAADSIEISNEQLEALTSLKVVEQGSDECVKLGANRRNVQPLLDRTVFASFEPSSVTRASKTWRFILPVGSIFKLRVTERISV